MKNPMTEWISSFITTGNTYIDTMLVTTILMRIDNISTQVISILLVVLSFIYTYVKTYVMKKMCGELGCTIRIEGNTTLGRNINKIIFDPDVRSDDIKHIMQMLNFHDYMSRMKKDAEVKEDYVSVNLSYSNDRLFNYDSGSIVDRIHGKENKMFRYGKYYIAITRESPYAEVVTSTDINTHVLTIKLITFDGKKDVDFYMDKVEEFLDKRFDINDKIEYVYNVCINDTVLRNHIHTLTSNCMIDPIAGILGCGDFVNTKKHADIVDIVLPSMELNVHATNIIDVIDDNSKLVVTHLNKSQGWHNANSVVEIFKNYGDKTIVDIDKCNIRCYFTKDDVLYMFIDNGTNLYITLVTKGKMESLDELREHINYLIKLGIENRPVNLPKKTLKAPIRKAVKMHKRYDRQWKTTILRKRSFDTVYFPTAILDKIHGEFQTFLANEKFFNEVEVSYRRGVLLYGPPGTGKTSLIMALAYHYQMEIWTFDLNDPEINDNSIIEILNSIGSSNRKILLFEDVDSAFSAKEEILYEKRVVAAGETSTIGPGTKSSCLTYSGLLQALEGVQSNHTGVMLMMTTNYEEKLGDAIRRPGRVDLELRLGECNHEQITAMTKRFISKMIKIKREVIESSPDSVTDNDIEIVNKYTELYIDHIAPRFTAKVVNKDGLSGIRPAFLQQYIFSHITNIDDIFEDKYINELLEKFPIPA